MSPIVTTDIRGLPRPEGSDYDVGAYEGAEGPVTGDPSLPPPPTPTGDVVPNFIARGSLAFSGFADSPMKFSSPEGLNLGIPANNPSLQGDGDGCTGLVQLIDGHYFANGNSGSIGTVCYDSQFATLIGSTVARTFGAASTSLHVYGIRVAVGDYEVWKYLDGVKIAAFSLDATHFPTSPVLGISPNGGTAYYGLTAGDTVYRVMLSGPARTTFTTETGYLLHAGSILVLPSGDILIGWTKTGDEGYIKRYNSSGVLQATYTLPGLHVGPVYFTLGLDASYSFWLSYHDETVDTWSQVSIIEIRISDGNILHRFGPNSGEFEYDGPFCVVRADIGTPVTSPPPASDIPNSSPSSSIPLITCAPITIISSPARNSGCNQGGVGWSPTYLGDSGFVPIGANPTDGESLTGHRVINVWAQIEHDNE